MTESQFWGSPVSWTQHSLSGYYYLGVPYWFFYRLPSVKPQSHISKKLWKRKTTFSYSLLVAYSHFPPHWTGVLKELYTFVFYPVMTVRDWFKTAELQSVLLAIKAWFDLDFQAATAQSLCILLQIVPPLYGFSAWPFWSYLKKLSGGSSFHGRILGLKNNSCSFSRRTFIWSRLPYNSYEAAFWAQNMLSSSS